jgi:hypothetical protein
MTLHFEQRRGTNCPHIAEAAFKSDSDGPWAVPSSAMFQMTAFHEGSL